MSTRVMSEHVLKLAKAPIVEAVLDIDCDMQPDFNLESVEESARDAYATNYPELQVRRFLEQQFEKVDNADPKLSTRSGLQAFLFFSGDRKQIVQVRSQGFSFNRLAPYSSLDEYLPEMKRTWSIFTSIIRPIRVRMVKLRYINRILLPLVKNKLDLDKYLKLGPRLPEEDKLTLSSFMNRNVAVDVETGHQVTIILASQAIQENQLPVIFDIEVVNNESVDLSNWDLILQQIQSLRNLKNRVFEHSLQSKYLELSNDESSS